MNTSDFSIEQSLLLDLFCIFILSAYTIKSTFMCFKICTFKLINEYF